MVFVLPFLAVVAGVLSFSSPCCLPLLPGYVSFIAGLPMSEVDQQANRRMVRRAALLFVVGFTAVFTALGISFAVVGSVLLRSVPLVTRIAGVAIIVMGLSMLGLIRVPFLNQERRLLGRVRPGPSSAFLLGVAFAFGWAPCIGPVLATILTTAAATQTVIWGAILLVLYSLGLGIPFIFLALGMQRASSSVGWLRRHGRAIERTGGTLLVSVGVLFVTGAWRTFFIPLQRYFSRLGWPPV